MASLALSRARWRGEPVDDLAVAAKPLIPRAAFARLHGAGPLEAVEDGVALARRLR